MSTSTAPAGTVPATRRRHHSLHRQRAWALWGSYIALGFFVVIFLVPPFYTLMTSFKSSAEISAQSGNPWFPHHPTLENFWYLITYPNFQTYYLNSVIITVLVVAISITISVLAAFSLARMGFWGSQALATGVFLTYLIPASLLFLPLFQIIGWLGLINSFWCLVLLYPTLAVPFCTWIMIGYFSSIPKELDEAALRTILARIIAETGASSPADMGKVMGIATKELAGQADGKTISAVAKELLAK